MVHEPKRPPQWVRSYNGPKLEFWVDRADVLQLATPETAAEAIRAAAELPAAHTTERVSNLLLQSGIVGFSPDSVEALRIVLASLRIPRFEATMGKPVDWPASRLHRLLPDVMRAAREYGDLLMVAAARRDGVAGGRGNRETIRGHLERIIALIEAAEQMPAFLPDPLPRQFALWHDDACFLANALIEQASRSGVDIGIARAASKGVRFVTACLAELGIARNTTPAAVAKVLQNNRDN